MANETLLVLSGNGVMPYSARGLSQTLDLIAGASQNRRSINGALVDLSQPQFRKYASTITCTDQNAPALDGIWPGMQLTVDCIAELSFKTAGGVQTRTAVPDSSRTEGAFTIYRPRLTMRVMAFNTNQNEYEASVAWSLQLEEV